MISPDKKFVFTHIGRSGGASIEAALKDVGLKKPHLSDMYSDKSKILEFKASQHWLSVEEQFVIGEDLWEEYFKFTIVRNPWDRLVSQYFGHVIKEVPGLSFEDYLIKSFVKKEYHDYERFTEPSMYWITDDDDNLMVDYIGKFETLQEDFDIICDKIGIERRILGQTGKSKREHYRTYYNDYTQELVYNYFKADIEEFGYEF
tara:strand:+ start:412 stop:1020 length:609 start_codon:yes stop_codon:yes gene_type:complete